jgi:hypothetical protein
LNLGTRAASIITDLRPIDLAKVTAESLFSETSMTMFRTCTQMADFAQELCDPHGRDEQARLCRQIVKHSADCKLNLTKLMANHLTEVQRDKATTKAINEYADMKSAIQRLFPLLNLHWGRTIPQLL